MISWRDFLEQFQYYVHEEFDDRSLQIDTMPNDDCNIKTKFISNRALKKYFRKCVVETEKRIREIKNKIAREDTATMNGNPNYEFTRDKDLIRIRVLRGVLKTYKELVKGLE